MFFFKLICKKWTGLCALKEHLKSRINAAKCPVLSQAVISVCNEPVREIEQHVSDSTHEGSGFSSRRPTFHHRGQARMGGVWIGGNHAAVRFEIWVAATSLMTVMNAVLLLSNQACTHTQYDWLPTWHYLNTQTHMHKVILLFKK